MVSSDFDIASPGVQERTLRQTLTGEAFQVQMLVCRKMLDLSLDRLRRPAPAWLLSAVEVTCNPLKGEGRDVSSTESRDRADLRPWNLCVYGYGNYTSA